MSIYMIWSYIKFPVPKKLKNSLKKQPHGPTKIKIPIISSNQTSFGCKLDKAINIFYVHQISAIFMSHYFLLTVHTICDTFERKTKEMY